MCVAKCGFCIWNDVEWCFKRGWMETTKQKWRNLSQLRQSLAPTRTHADTNIHIHVTHVRTYARTHVRTYARTHVRTYARTHVRTYAHTHACIHTNTHTRMFEGGYFLFSFCYSCSTDLLSYLAPRLPMRRAMLYCQYWVAVLFSQHPLKAQTRQPMLNINNWLVTGSMNTSRVIYLVGRVSDWTFWPQKSVNTYGIRLLEVADTRIAFRGHQYLLSCQ